MSPQISKGLKPHIIFGNPSVVPEDMRQSIPPDKQVVMLFFPDGETFRREKGGVVEIIVYAETVGNCIRILSTLLRDRKSNTTLRLKNDRTYH